MSFRFLTAGESHGKGLMGILEGIPSGLEISTEYLHSQLKRRKLGFGRGGRQKIETDEVELISGVRRGFTLGSPIGLWIANRDWSVWEKIMKVEADSEPSERQVTVPRPGHADLIGGIKYRHQDLRNVLERSSARETTMRVALGSVARKFLEELNIHIASRVVRIGTVQDRSQKSSVHPVPLHELNAIIDRSPVRCQDEKASEEMVNEVERAQKEGETLGGEFEVSASGVPVGLGSYAQWDRRLEAEIARSFMSLNAIKGMEIGLGFEASKRRGSEVHDELYPGSTPGKLSYKTNRSGGIEGGMSTGQPLVIRAAMKPLATLMKPLQSVDLETGEAQPAHVERSDVCAVPAAAVIGESLLALALTGVLLEKFGGDSMSELKGRVEVWNREIPLES